MSDSLPSSARPRPRGVLSVLGPGILVAATGVGAGDLATAGLAGSNLGLAIAWAALFGAILKYILSENLARWQIGTGETVLAGAIRHLGWPVHLGFGLYMLPWSVFVGTAIVAGCGVTLHALMPGVFDDPTTGKICFGAASSIVGLVLVWTGGFRLFERVMLVCVGVMVCITIAAAVLARPDAGDLVRGIFVPTVPGITSADPAQARQALEWTIALIGGVGGTLTLIAYSYWMRETGRTNRDDLATCRIDLAAGYTMTALFGVAMVVVAHRVTVDKTGAGLVISLADTVRDSVAAAFGPAAGRAGRLVFLLGALAAMFSSLLGVWQVVPVIFGDWWMRRGGRTPARETVDQRSWPVRGFMIWIALISLPGLVIPFASVQKWYAIVGAGFVPALAAVLLLLNGRARHGMPAELRNRTGGTLLLAATLVLLGSVAVYDIAGRTGLRGRATPAVAPASPANAANAANAATPAPVPTEIPAGPTAPADAAAPGPAPGDNVDAPANVNPPDRPAEDLDPAAGSESAP
ncbi:MAG: Nramp family divalent metal transporter [Phycisphaerales bacterium]